LAHRGLLLLDELPEWSRPAIEALRVPLEQGVVDLARAAGTTQLPAQCLVAATANPCPCGYFLDAERRCRCTPAQVRNYLKRLSGPLVDRFPIHLETAASSDAAPTMTTAEARERVLRARKQLRMEGHWEAEAMDQLERGIQRWRFSGRARVALRALARTHAALDEREAITAADVDAALGYRVFDRAGWLEAAWDPHRPKHRS
jgi:magnesium chelatase family protein